MYFIVILNHTKIVGIKNTVNTFCKSIVKTYNVFYELNAKSLHELIVTIPYLEKGEK